MTNTLGMPRVQALTAVVISVFTGIVLTPLMGVIADRIGNAKVYIFGTVFTFAFAFPLFALLDTRNVALASLAMSLGYGLGFGGLNGAQGAFLANLFPDALPILRNRPDARNERAADRGAAPLHRLGPSWPHPAERRNTSPST
jgi:MFS family permease